MAARRSSRTAQPRGPKRRCCARSRRPEPPAPTVLAVSDGALVLEMRLSGGALHDAWESLGEALASLHASLAPRYGWTEDYAFGPLPILNGGADDWPSFWAERRLLPHVPQLPTDLAKRIEALASDLPNRLPARPKPSLLHGDMWSGNVLVANGGISGLIDPACYHGHGEVDIAMLGLFDRPGAAFLGAYGALEPGHADRLAIYRLWPALVHLRLFGDSYRPTAEQILSATGA